MSSANPSPPPSATPVRRALVGVVAAVACALTGAAQAQTLKQAYRGVFHIGAALPPAIFTGQDPRGAALVAEQFDTISPENSLKWALIHPRPGVYAFDEADHYVAFGQTHGLFTIGHTLVWHQQVPDWVFQDDHGKRLGREALLARLHDHIATVVGRYRGKIAGWDVVNEALADDGSLRQTPWLQIIGPDYIEKAFEFAHEADPAAELYYNDYSLENPEKRRGALALVARLKAKGVPIVAVGLQDHNSLDWPSAQLEDETLSDFARLGVKLNISELDVDVLPRPAANGSADISARFAATAGSNPYTRGLPAPVQVDLAKRYAALFAVFVKHRAEIERVTFWGVDDGGSWLNGWPIPGRTNHPLLFDRQDRPKPAFDAVLHAADAAHR
jgi:endo-1,4-beta-xylanase